MANEAFTKTWAIALASDDTFETITDFYATASSPRPEIKRSSISIEGMDGVIDTTELSGGVKYNNRTVNLWLITKSDTTEADVDSFISKYVDRVVWLKNVTDGYQYKGRLTLVFDTEVGSPRKLKFEMDAEPFKYAIGDTVYGNYTSVADVHKLDFLNEIKVSGGLTASSHRYDDEYVTIFRGAAGQYALYEFPVTQGNFYIAEIETRAATVEILDANNNAYDPDGFTATGSKIRIRITADSNMPCSAKVTLNRISFFSVQNDGVDVLAYYDTLNPTGTSFLFLNGKLIPLDYTKTPKTSPDLVIKHGENKFAFVTFSIEEGAEKVFLSWREAHV